MTAAPGGDSLLGRLAALYGVQTSYEDMEHATVPANRDSLFAVLRSLGAPVENEYDLPDAVARRERELWQRAVEPVVVVWEGERLACELRLPASSEPRTLRLQLMLEDASYQQFELPVADARVLDRATVDGDAYELRRFELPFAPTAGYHALVIEGLASSAETLVVCAPRKASSGSTAISRRWGLFAPLYALHTRAHPAAANLDDYARYLEWTASKGVGLVGTLPLLATFAHDPSPYAPISRLFWNELYVTTGAVQEPEPHDDLVPYAELLRARRNDLLLLNADLDPGESTRFAGFLERRPEVGDYARFRATQERLGRNWRAWPPEQRDGRLEPGDYDEQAYRFYTTAQWRLDEQMHALAERARALDVEFYLDLPVGVHQDGYDAWRYRSLFVEGMSVGAPPDVVTTSGQDWGFAPLHPERLRESGYEYLIRYLRHHFAAAGVARIDHAMGLHRLYWVPHGAGARNGVYVNQPAEELYAVHCLESSRHQTAIVGENLGIVPDEVNEALTGHNFGRMYVMSLELTGEAKQPFHVIPEAVVASFGTHDLPTFAAFWLDLDQEDRIRLGVLDPESAAREKTSRAVYKQALLAYLQDEGLLARDAKPRAKPSRVARPAAADPPDVPSAHDPAAVFEAVLTLLARSDAQRVLVNLEDLWLETQPQNIPGTSAAQYPNWSRRTDYAIDDLDEQPDVRRLLATLQRLRPKGGTA